jgi:fructokinase
MLAGVELGGTKCICILGTGPGDVRAQVEVPTTSPRATLATIADILDGWDFQTLGIASFGPLDLDRSSTRFGSIVSTPKAGWSGTDLTALARGGLVTIDTDVNGAALAEGLWGAAQDLESWAYITVGTGIGVGSIARRQILRGAGHSEAGHQRVPKLVGDMFAGTCVYHGDCVEGLASGPAISARCGNLAHDIPSDDLTTFHPMTRFGTMLRMLLPCCATISCSRRYRSAYSSVDYSTAGYGMPADFDDLIVPPGLGHAAGPLGSLALASTVVK